MSVQTDDLLHIIETASAGPSKVTGDAGSVEQHALTELIAAHKYLSGADGTTNTGGRAARGIRFTRLIPGGTT